MGPNSPLPIRRAGLNPSLNNFFYWAVIHLQQDLLSLENSFKGTIWRAKCSSLLRPYCVAPKAPTYGCRSVGARPPFAC